MNQYMKTKFIVLLLSLSIAFTNTLLAQTIYYNKGRRSFCAGSHGRASCKHFGICYSKRPIWF